MECGEDHKRRRSIRREQGGRQDLGAVWKKTYSIGIKLPSRPSTRNESPVSSRSHVKSPRTPPPCKRKTSACDDTHKVWSWHRGKGPDRARQKRNTRKSGALTSHEPKKELEMDILSPSSLPCRPIRSDGSRRSISFAGNTRSHPTEARQT
jgi:hypothetical protein